MTRIPTHRPPTHPGEMLLEEFLKPMGMTQQQLAEAIHLPYQQINEIISGYRGISPSIALRLAKYFKMSPDFWLNNQQGWDLYHTQLAEADVLERIQPIES
jgi:addiction module HigA family antidote